MKERVLMKEGVMDKSHLLAAAGFGLAMFAIATMFAAIFATMFASPRLWAQQAPPSGNGVPTHVLVTVEAKHGRDVPDVRREDVMVYEGKDRDTVTDWVPAQGDHAGLELFVLLDDGSRSTLGSQIKSIADFIGSQPASTKIGVAYMQNGEAKIVQGPTNDHAAAAKSLRLPLGIPGINASPYISLSDLIKRWPESADRREVVMVSDGADPYYGTGDMNDPYLDAAIDDARKAGVQVYAIYMPGAGHFGHDYWQTYWGQIYLSKTTDETGGESYAIGFAGTPVSFTPFLNDVANRLNHQYLLTFLAKPPKRAGWQRVKLMTEVSNAQLVSAGQVWVAEQ
jgi:hypothetical protein